MRGTARRSGRVALGTFAGLDEGDEVLLTNDQGSPTVSRSRTATTRPAA